MRKKHVLSHTQKTCSESRLALLQTSWNGTRIKSSLSPSHFCPHRVCEPCAHRHYCHNMSATGRSVNPLHVLGWREGREGGRLDRLSLRSHPVQSSDHTRVSRMSQFSVFVFSFTVLIYRCLYPVIPCTCCASDLLYLQWHLILCLDNTSPALLCTYLINVFNSGTNIHHIPPLWKELHS